MSLIIDLLLVMAGIIIILVSAKRGFFKNLVRSLRWILALIFTNLFGGAVSSFLQDTVVGGAVRGFLHGRVSTLYENTAGATDAEQLLSEIPPFLRTEELEAKLLAGGGERDEWIDSVTELLSAPVATFFSNLFAYVGVFILSLIALWFVVKLFDGVLKRVRIIGRIDTALGLVWGILLALILWLSVSSLFRAFFADSAIYTDSKVLQFFGETARQGIFKLFDVGGLLFLNLIS